MLEYMTDLVARLGHWGYVFIFAVAACESAAFLGLLVPGESLVLFTGFLASRGVLDLDALIIIVAVGAAVGDNIGYELGTRLGRPWLLRHGARFGLGESRLRRTEEFFKRHGGKSVFFGRFVGFARALVPFVAGSARMRYGIFVAYNALGAALWGPMVVLVGYFGGALAGRWLGRATAVLAGIVLFVLLLAWAGRWIARHEAQVNAYRDRMAQWPAVAAVLERFAPQLAWVRRRLTPGSYFGLQLTIAILAFLAAAWLFGGVTEDVLSGDPLTTVDKTLEAWLSMHREEFLTSLMSAVSWLHTWPSGVAAAFFIGYVSFARAWRWVVFSIAAVPGGMLVNTAVKTIIHRERPTLSGLSAALDTFGFPSGHTIAATLIYGVAATYLASRTRRWELRVAFAVGAVFLVVLVATSRLYLGVHYLSDVLAAMAEGVAWLTVCHIAVNTWWIRRAGNPR